MEAISKSEEETEKLAADLATRLKAGDNVCLYGELGAGKTCFTRGIVSSLHDKNSSPVKSPSYTLLNIYGGEPVIYHFDFFRVENGDDISELGLDDYWGGDGICIVEWPKDFCASLPGRTIDVIIDFIEETKRNIKINIPDNG